MKPVSWILAAAALLLGGAIGQSPSPGGLPVTYERLLKAAEEPGNWLMYGGDYRSHHHSSLNQITVDNVARLRAKWIYQMHRPKVETTPIVVDGRMYVTRPPSDVSALDANSGRLLWKRELANPAMNYSATGAPLAVKDKVIAGIAGAEGGIRGFLDAYDATTGERAWRFWTIPAPGEPGSETWEAIHGGTAGDRRG